jgi:dUTP pyrophosphatase
MMSPKTEMNDRIRVPIKRLEGNTDLPLPRYLSAGAVGLDLHAAVTESVSILPGEVSSIPCGLAIGLPSGFEAQVRPRSGLAVKHSISILNTPGTIDSDYRGEIKVLLINLGSEAFRVERGMRVAQLVIMPVPRVEWDEVDDLPASVRSDGGFGHTGQ